MIRKNPFGRNNESIIDVLIKELRFNKIKGLIFQNSTVVDLGCGYQADLLCSVSKKIKIGIGLDLSVAKFKLKKITLKEANLNKKMPINDAIADVVIAMAIIEHIENPRLLLLECYRILKPGGILMLTTPSIKAKGLLEFLAYKLKIISQVEISDHKHYYDIDCLRQEFLRAGFKKNNISVQTFQLGFNLMAKCIK